VPGIQCACGERIPYGDIPNPTEWLFISDTEFDSIAGEIDAEVLYQRMKSFLQCPTCMRIWIFWDGFGAPPAEYALQGPSDVKSLSS
jgi:hypothetical protein